MGIIIVIAGVAVPFYMSHFETARIGQISLTATEYFKAMEACLLINNEDLSKCNTKTKIKFDCDECSSLSLHLIQDRLTATITKDRLSACMIYRKDCILKTRVTLNKSLCSLKPPVPDNICGYGTIPQQHARQPAFPLKTCSSNSDCPSSQVCFAFTGKKNPNGGCQ